jgi:steroid delta-isomerase-like uncharacterized protein
LTIQENKMVIRRFLADLDNDRSAVDDFCAAHFVAHLPGMPGRTDTKGFKEFVVALYKAFPDFHHVVEDQIAEGNTVVTRVTAVGTHKGDFQGMPATGHKVQVADIMITRIEDGKAVELWAQFDSLGLAQQIGASS